MAYILGFESSCDETSASVVRMDESGPNKRKILSNIIASQAKTHALFGGVVPEVASRAHCEVISQITKEALDTAGISVKKLDGVAATYSPGLIGPLLVGVSFAKSFAYANGLPIIPVNHIKGHTAAAYLENPDLETPFVSLVVSGGHTSMFDVTDPVSFREISSSRDDAAGEAFDKVGRSMGLPYPCGRSMDELAAKGSELDKLPPFPSPAINDGSLDFSFSGLKTHSINCIHNLKQKYRLTDNDRFPDELAAMVAYSFTESVINGISANLGKAIRKYDPQRIVLAGGVAANTHLRKKVGELCNSEHKSLFIPSVGLCGDNAAMIAAQGYYELRSGNTAPLTLNAYASDEAPEY